MNSDKIKSKGLIELGSRLREERLRHSLTQSALSALCGLSVQAQGYYESGERAPNAEYFLHLHEQGFDINFVLLGDNPGELSTMKINTKILTEILEEIQNCESIRKKQFSLDIKAELISLFIAQFSNQKNIDRDIIRGHLRLVK